MKTQISLSELIHLLEKGNKVLLIDVRTEEEYLELHIPQAIHISLEQLRNKNYTLEYHSQLVTL